MSRPALDADQVDRDTLAGFRALDLPIVDVDATDADPGPAGSTRSESPSAIEPDHSVPVATVPIPRR